MRATWDFALIMVGLWLMGVFQHTPNPTWAQLWIGLVSWAVVDIAFLSLRWFHRKTMKTRSALRGDCP
jgi:hypothetical protein